MFHVLVSTGARASEFLDLNLEDVDVFTGEVTIRHGKGDKPRYAFLGREAKKALKRYLLIHPRELNCLWVNDCGDPMTISGLRYTMNKYAKKLNLGHIELHDFRRCFALSCYRNGVDIFSISQLLGHSSVEVTKRYLAVTLDDLKLAHKKGNPLD